MDEKEENLNIQVQESSKEKIVRNIKFSIYHTYYTLLSFKFTSCLFYIILLIIEFIQCSLLLLFHLSFSDFSSDNNSIALPLQYKHINSFIKKTNVIYNIVVNQSKIVNLVVLYICSCYILIHIAVFLYFSSHFKGNKRRRTIFADYFYKILFFFDTFQITIFTIPLYINFFSFFTCNSNKTFLLNIPSLECNNGYYYTNITFSIFCIIFFTILGLLNCIFLNDNQPTSQLPWSNSFNYSRLFFFLEKICLSVFTIFSFNNKYYAKVIIVLILNILCCLIRFYNTFFYKNSIKYFTICFEYTSLFNCIIGLINQLYKSNEYDTSTLIIETLCSISFGLFSIFVMKKYKRSIIYYKSSTCIKNILLYNKLQALLSFAIEEKYKDFKDSIFMSLLQKHRIKCTDYSCKCNQYIRFVVNHYNENQYTFESYKNPKTLKSRSTRLKLDNYSNTQIQGSIRHSYLEVNKSSDLQLVSKEEIEEEQIKLLFDLKGEEEDITFEKVMFGVIRLEIEDILSKGINTASIRILYSYISLFYMDNINKSLYELMKIPSQNQNFIINYEIFLMRMSIEKKMQENLYNSIKDNKDLSMETILLFNNLTNQILDLINSTSLVVIKFWEEILGFYSNMKNEDGKKNKDNSNEYSTKKIKNNQAVYKHAVQISKNMIKMNKIFKELRHNNNFFNRIVYTLYAEFLKQVICNEEQGQEIDEYLISKADINKDNNDKENTLIFSNGKINMDEIGSCVISGDLMKLGNILHCNLQFGNIFKYEQKDLKMEKINKIIPSFISDFHNEFILRYLETGKSHISGKNRLLFGLRSDGLMVLIVLFVKTVPNLENSVRFIGLVKKVSKNHPLWRIPQCLSEEDQDGLIQLNDNSPYENQYAKYVSYLLTNESGKVFGITKNAIKLYGIPLNVLLPKNYTENINTNNNINNTIEDKTSTSAVLVKETKILDIKNILNDLNFDNSEQMNKLKSNYGLEMTIETSKLKNYYNDFVESLQNSNSIMIKTLRHFDANFAFLRQAVLVKLTEIAFNDSTMKIKVFKIIKLKNSAMNKPFKNTIIKNRHHLSGDQSPKSRKALSPNNSIRKEKTAKYIEEPILLKKDTTKIYKASVKSFSLPYQIILFIVNFVLLLLFIFSSGLIEFFFTKHYIQELQNYINLYQHINERNLLLIIILQNFRVTSLIDNELLDDIDRSNVIKKINYDIELIMGITNQMKVSIDTIDDDISYLHNEKNISALHLNNSFGVTYTIEKFVFVLNQIVAKINFCINDLPSLNFGNKALVFYNNSNFANNLVPGFLTKEVYYIIENYSFTIRNEMEHSINIMQQKLKSKSSFSSNLRNIMCYLPFGYIVIFFTVFILLLGKITEYKISILKVFYVVNKKYGYEIIKKCNMFLEYTGNLTKYTKYDIDYVMKELSNTNEKEDAQSSNDEKVSLNSHALLMNSRNKNAMFFWEREEKEKQNDVEEKIIGEKVSNELTESKKELKKKMFIIIIEIILLFIAYIIYFALTITFNISFDNSIVDTIDYIYLFTNRGWVFSNFIYFYREMLISISNNQTVSSYDNSPLYTNNSQEYTHKDLFHLYMTKSYSIESDILLLTNEFLKGYNNDILKGVVQQERELNSEQYCSILKSYYNEFVTDDYCNEYYSMNNGIKDNIQIITSYIQTHIPNYDNKTIEEMKEYLQMNITFVDYNQKLISLACLGELNTVIEGINDFIDNYRTNSIIRISVFVFGVVLELTFYSLIWNYLNKMLIKDKAILNIIPNEAISYSQKVKNALTNLNNFK